MTPNVRKIDRWFPIDAVDEACGNAIGSGLVEKQIMTWFASRPIAQARAAVLTALLPDANGETQRLIDIAVRGYDAQAREPGGGKEIAFATAIERLAARIREQFPDGPVVLDPFSGRGIIPLEAARFGAKSIGTDLSPLATLGGRLLATYPYQDWSSEPPLPPEWGSPAAQSQVDVGDSKDRLVADLSVIFDEVGKRAKSATRHMYPEPESGRTIWGYFWAVTFICDGCERRTPIVGRLELRHPYVRAGDRGQSLSIESVNGELVVDVVDGPPTREPTMGTGQRAVARCVHCDRTHTRDALRRKGAVAEFDDLLLAVAELGANRNAAKVFRAPTDEERRAVAAVTPPDSWNALSPVPEEPISAGIGDAVKARGYGRTDFGSLMCRRQQAQMASYCKVIAELGEDLLRNSNSREYATALTGYATSVLVRRLKYTTRGATLYVGGNTSGTKKSSIKAEHVYASESSVGDSFDFFEVGTDDGPATWRSVAFGPPAGSLNAIGSVAVTDRKIKGLGRYYHDWRATTTPATFRQASATALPLRDGSVDVIVTDPPYYNMIDYSDASDFLYVWVRRALYDAMPDLFGPDAPVLQNKADEIIVKRGASKEDHRTKAWYHEQLAAAFSEMRRVLKEDGHLTVVFGHHDPDAWKRLLGALGDAGFVVTSSWPSRTEAGNTGVASIKVTVSIGCRVAPPGRPDGLMNQVDLEIRNEVAARVKRWTDDGLALPDQLMAAYGPAMEVYGRYATVYQPNGEPVDLERYLLLARAVVKDTVAMKVDELPLETFDAETRLAVAWLRFYGHTVVQKGEARFMAQTEAIRIDDVRDLFVESKNGFKLNTDPTDVEVSERTPVFALVLAMCARMSGETESDLVGVDGAAAVLAAAESTGALSKPSDPHLWSVVSELHQKLADSSKTGKALARIVRSKQQIINAADRDRSKVAQRVDAEVAQTKFDLTGSEA